MTRIASIACALPENEVSNNDLEREHPAWDVARVAKRTGVLSRRLAGPEETAFDLSVRACDTLIAESGLDLDSIGAILYCTQSPDYPMPGNAHLLHRHLGIDDEVLAFDFNLACSGYVYGLAFADALVSRGLASEALLVTAETYSKHTDPEDRATRTLFGDGAAVTHLSAIAREGGRIVASKLCTRGRDLERFYVPVGGARVPSPGKATPEGFNRPDNIHSPEKIHMDGRAVWAFVNTVVPKHIRGFLDEQSLTLDDIDFFVFHQASKMTFDSLAKSLGIPREKLYTNMAKLGNLVSASIPFALHDVLEGEAIEAGDRVLLCGFGVGFSYGSVLLEF